MKLDRKSQVWQIAEDILPESARYRGRDVEWKTFTVISTSEQQYETISGEQRTYVKHRVFVSDSGAVVDLNEDINIQWERCAEYRRVA